MKTIFVLHHPRLWPGSGERQARAPRPPALLIESTKASIINSWKTNIITVNICWEKDIYNVSHQLNLVDKIQNEDYCDGNLDVPRSELAKRSRSGLQAIVVLDPQDEAKLAQAYH